MSYRMLFFALLVLAAVSGSALLQAAGELAPQDEVWIYRDAPPAGEPDERSQTERLFQPYGFMPAEGASDIAVNVSHPADQNNPEKGTAVEIVFSFPTATAWRGAYFLLDDGTSWGKRPGINVQKLMGLKPDDKIAVRFLAWGGGTVTFKCGGVRDGKHPSSLRLPVAAPGSPTRLSTRPKEITIGPIPARMLTNVIDPLCAVASGLDQKGAEEVTVYIDDIRFERFEKSAVSAVEWTKKLAETLWVSYTPTGFDPTASPIVHPTLENIRADLAALESLREESRLPRAALGIVTYGADNGLEQIPSVCREFGIPLQLGIFSPTNRTEVANAKQLLADESLSGTIIGVIVGNEALTFRRGTLNDIERVIAELKSMRDVPCTSTEIVQEMGNERLKSLCDYLSVNAHAVFASIYEPLDAAAWAEDHVSAVIELSAEKPLLIKEVGWPSGSFASASGPVPFSPTAQRAYWTALMKSPVARHANIGVFDAFRNTPWKHEEVVVPGGIRIDVGNCWAVLFDEQREPLPFASELLKLWKQSRTDN